MVRSPCLNELVRTVHVLVLNYDSGPRHNFKLQLFQPTIVKQRGSSFYVAKDIVLPYA
jgi:hypothetical protein